MFSLNFHFVQMLKNSTSPEKMLFTFRKLRNNITITAAYRHRDVHVSALTNIDIKNDILGKQRKLSRYCANTIMPHFKEFRIMDYDIIGFDLDGTLLRYDLNNMVPLEYDLLSQYLVNEKNYPKTLLEQKFDPNFLQKGLFIDAERGNILKLAVDGTILKAAHGTKFLQDQEIRELYGEKKKCDLIQQYVKDPLSIWGGPMAEKLRALLDYFDIGASLVFAQAVDILDKISPSEYGLGKSNYKIYPDMLTGLIKLYGRLNFINGDSGYFTALKENPEKYMLKTDQKVIELLMQLKSSGKALYLLTGSNIDFANFTASYALGQNWQDIFDCTIAFAKKPGFFSMQRQFLKVENLTEIEGSELPLTDDLAPNGCYSQGNWQQLKESLCKRVLHKDAEKVRSLYIGDNLMQDVYAPSAVSAIDTVALSEELLENDNNYPFKSIVQSSLWGSYFNIDGTSTLWSNIIEKYSQLCVSHMDVLAEVPIREKIHCENVGYFRNPQN